MVGKLCSALFFFAAWWCYRPPKSTVGTENPLNISVVEEDLNAHVTRTNRVHQTLTTEARDSRPRWWESLITTWWLHSHTLNHMHTFRKCSSSSLTIVLSSCFIDKSGPSLPSILQSINIAKYDLNPNGGHAPTILHWNSWTMCLSVSLVYVCIC